MTASANLPPQPGEPEFRRRYRELIRSRGFWQKVWNRMADAFRSCNLECFDDGTAVGQISAAGYCSASMELQGLPGIGFIEQPSMPVCETSIFVGCVQAYQDTAFSTPGCEVYASDDFASIFSEYQSQDCHLE